MMLSDICRGHPVRGRHVRLDGSYWLIEPGLAGLAQVCNDMSFVVLDEVGAIVIDIGSSTFRGGYAGEDMPKVR